MRRTPSDRTIKRLFAASGGVCAFPECTTRLVDEQSGALLGEMCHIHAASEGGPRYDSTQSDVERNEESNLIILCPTHHSLIDQSSSMYPASALYSMKARHEARIAALVTGTFTEIDDRQATDFARQIAGKSVDFAIIVAQKVQLKAIMQHFPELQATPRVVASSQYYTASIRLVTMMLPTIGNLAASSATADLLRDWNPRYVIVTGLAGGLVRRDQALGDIVIGNSISYYESGTVQNSGIELKNRTFTADPTLLAGISATNIAKWRTRLPQRPTDGDANSVWPKVHIGTVLSGEKIIRSSAEVERLQRYDRKIIAVEMESAGVASVAFSAIKKVGFITVRAIADFAEDKLDHPEYASLREYAALSVASWLRTFLEQRPIAPSEGKWPAGGHTADLSSHITVAAQRRHLFDLLCDAYDLEEFKNFCFLLGVDVDELPGDRKSSRVRELILFFERRKQIHILESAVAENIRSG
jgi:nucleoside phosphorylase